MTTCGGCGGCLEVIDIIVRRFVCGGSAAVAAVVRNLLKTLVRRLCGGCAGLTPIPPSGVSAPFKGDTPHL